MNKKSGLIVGCLLLMVLMLGGWRSGNLYKGKINLVNTQTLDLSGNEEISVTYNMDDINFYENDENKIVIKEYMNKNQKKYYAKIDQTDEAISIQAGNRRKVKRLIAYVKIYLPKSFQGKLTAKTTSGDIEHRLGAHLAAAKFQTTSGDIDFKQLNASNISIQTTSGDVNGKDFSGKLVAKSTSGDLEVLTGHGSGNFKTTSGEIAVDFKEVTGDLTAETVDGEIICSLPNEASYNLSAKTVSGEINNEHTNKNNLTISERSQKGAVGTDPSFKVKLQSVSGDIEIE